MKLLMVVILLMGSLTTFASEDPYFLNSKEFKELSREEQANYLKSLQKIIADMTKKTLYMASNEDLGSSRSPASAVGQQVDQLVESTFTDANGAGFKVRTGAVRSADIQGKDLPKLAPVKPAQKYMGPASTGNAEADALAELVRKERQETKDKYNIVYVDGDGNPSRQPAKYRNKNMPSANSAAATAPAPAAALATAPAAAEKSDKKPASQNSNEIVEFADGTTVGTEVITEDSKKKKGRSHYRCMYSGWVIEKDPCQAQQKFPDNYNIKGVDKAKMICEPKETMCNPTLFGLTLPKDCKKFADCADQAVPLCVLKGAWPTEDCYKISSKQATLVAADIANSDSVQYERFIVKFADLCDAEQIKTNPFAEPNNRRNQKNSPEAIRRDINITCGWAVKKMHAVSDTYRQTYLAKGKGSAPKKGGTPSGDSQKVQK